MAKAKNNKVRKNFIFPSDLADWAAQYAKEKNTSMTQLIVDYLTDLKKREESEYATQV